MCLEICVDDQNSRYLIVLNEGPVKLFEFENCEHMADGLTTIDEVHSAITVSFVACTYRLAEATAKWADQVEAHVRQGCGNNSSSLKFGLERVNSAAAKALEAKGFILEDAQEVLELARSIKTPEEIKCVQESLDSTAKAVGKLRSKIRPGITENALWSEMHTSIIEDGGEYVETRLMSR